MITRPDYYAVNIYNYKHISTTVHHNYVVEEPKGAFEQDIANRLSEGHMHFGREEYCLALRSYSEAAWLILTMVDPEMPPWPEHVEDAGLPWMIGPEHFEHILDACLGVLRRIPIPRPRIPEGLLDPRVDPIPEITQQAVLYIDQGLKNTKLSDTVVNIVNQAIHALEANQVDESIGLFKDAQQHMTKAEPEAKSILQYGLGAAYSRAKQYDEAAAAFQKSATYAKQAGNAKMQLDANQAALPILLHQDKKAEAKLTQAKITSLSKELEVSGIGLAALGTPATTSSQPLVAATLAKPSSAGEKALSPGAANSVGIRVGDKVKKFALQDAALTSKVTKQLYEDRIQTADLSVLGSYGYSVTSFVAYLPHVYFFVLPMCMGDVYAEMGEYTTALEKYSSVLAYPYLNETIEAMRVWLKMAQVYLDWGDALFRQAKDQTSLLTEARAKYEQIVRNDRAATGSPLYSATHFARMADQVNYILQNLDHPNLLSKKNPLLVAAVLAAREAIFKLDHSLNFYGFAADYIPPFTFEYLQNVARYFAQHAAQAERDYMNFKTNAENATFTRMQLQQNVALMEASVELENRRVTEAQAGVSVAQASLNLTQTQLATSQANANDFRNNAPELLQITGLEAYANAASVDLDDEVRITTAGYGYNYYSVEDRPRSWVVMDLATRRTQINMQMEQNRLDRQVIVAQDYVNVAQQQLVQAQTRVSVAQQGVVIAQMRQQDAQDNLMYFTDKEFNDTMWYELATRIRRIARRYVDYGIEIAFLMERAYQVETGRDLNVIRFDYDSYGPAGLLAGDYLLHDIDYFTVDRLISTRSKQIPVKQTFSLADCYPYAFYQLLQTGQCTFETTLAQFDEVYPGTYLQKVKNVELIIVGDISPAGVFGTLRNVGVSTYRDPAGVQKHLVYPSDTMLLSQYELRRDMLVFRPSNDQLRLFENNGVATLWQLSLPRRINDLDYTRLLDVQLIIYYETFYSSAIEAAVRATLPASGAATRAISLRASYPDEMYFLANQGSAEIAFTASQFPRNQLNPLRTRIQFRVAGATVADGAGLTFRLSAPGLTNPLVLTTDSNGYVTSNPAVPSMPLNSLLNRTLYESWTLTFDPADNPGRTRSVDGQTRVDFSRIRDLQIFQEYSFTYAS